MEKEAGRCGRKKESEPNKLLEGFILFFANFVFLNDCSML